MIMGKSILHNTWKREQFREKWRDGERMRGFALLGMNEFSLWHRFVFGNLRYPLTARKRHICAAWENPRKSKAAPHNGARRFGQCFDPSESMENVGILDVFPIFHAARLGAKDPPKPAAPIVRCCLSIFAKISVPWKTRFFLREGRICFCCFP